MGIEVDYLIGEDVALVDDERYVREEKAKELEAENAKLRELVKDFLDVPCQCLKCEHYNYEEDRCDLRDRASELGVEVD